MVRAARRPVPSRLRRASVATATQPHRPPNGAQSITVGELARTYKVSLPEGYDPSHAYRLVFAFHGQGNTGDGVSNQYYFGIEQKGGTPSIFVYPDGG